MMTSKPKNLFILGFPKCASTSLAYLLNQHPEISMGESKEPSYFYSIIGKKLSWDDYNNLYPRFQTTLGGSMEHHGIFIANEH